MSRCTILRGSSTFRGFTTAARANVPHETLSRWTPISTVEKHNTKRRKEPEKPANVQQEGVSSVTEFGNISVIQDGPQVDSKGPKLGRGKLEDNFDHAGATEIGIDPKPDISLSSTDIKASPIFPVSPLMDPDFLQARKKHLLPKQLPPKNPSQFQQEFAKNPFALALASPMRQCGLTDVRLPKFFIQDFKMLSHPETNVPFFLPTSLTRKGSKDNPPYDIAKSIEGMTGYTLANRATLASMQDPTSGYFKSRSGGSQRVHHRLAPPSIKMVKPAWKTVMESKWRPDMETFVLELIRRRCIEQLVNLIDLKRGYLVGCVDWEDAASKPSVAAFLWTGGKEDEPSSHPEDFATLDLGMEGGLKGGEKKKRRKVPVYNMRSLFEPERLAELRNVGNGIFDRDVVALKHKKMTVEIQMLFWKLQGYTADYDKILEERQRNGEGDEDDYEGEFDDEDFDEDEEDTDD